LRARCPCPTRVPGPSTSPLAVAVKGSLVISGVVFFVCAGTLWWLWAKLAAPGPVAATVVVSEDYSTCAVNIQGFSTHRDVHCSNVAAYLRDVAHLGVGAGVMVRPKGKYRKESWEAMTQQIKAAGFLPNPHTGGVGPEVPGDDR